MVALVLAVVALAADARAEPPALQAKLSCAPAGEPGRVRCEVEAQVTGAQIRWADAEIVSVPDHITPLKGRIGPRDATLREPSLWRLSLALVAKRTGAGQVVARVRAVACTGESETCVPLVAEARGDVKVGQ